MHALLESDYPILMYIFHFFLLCRGPKGEIWHNTLTLNTPLDVHVLMVAAYYSQLETIQQVFSKGVVCWYCFFVKSFIYVKIYQYISVGA